MEGIKDSIDTTVYNSATCAAVAAVEVEVNAKVVYDDKSSLKSMIWFTEKLIV